jgi:hypothetical protein
MERYLKIVALVIIFVGCYLGVRYVGSEIHYACEVPEEDCPPPFRGVADLGFYLTGGELVPLWTRN